MTTIILVRHGESQANKDGIFAGHLDTDITALGLAQAEKTAEYIYDTYKIDRAYSSDLKRAFRTGKAAADKFGLEVIPLKELREIEAGEWDGMVFDELPEKFPKEFDIWMHNMGKAHCPGGESVAELSERIMAALNKIADENASKTVLVATHATPIRVAMTAVKYGSVEKTTDVPWVTNASVTVIQRNEGKWSLVTVSEDKHLKGMTTALPDNV